MVISEDEKNPSPKNEVSDPTRLMFSLCFNSKNRSVMSKNCDKIMQQFLADTVYYYFSLFLQNNYYQIDFVCRKGF